MSQDFDLEEALKNVHSAGQRPQQLERALVFLPDSMRAEQKPKKKAERQVPQQLELKPKMPDWSTIGQNPPVQTSAPEERRPPVSRRRHGCALCGSKTVLCKDDGEPFAHKCPHRTWCGSENGHAKCQQCEAERVRKAEARLIQGSEVRRQFLENVKQADAQAPRVGWDLVIVRGPEKCPMCQKMLQGEQAVRVWTWSLQAHKWIRNNVQCPRHPRPGVPMEEMESNYFERWAKGSEAEWVQYTRIAKEADGTRYRVLDKDKNIVLDMFVGSSQPQTKHREIEEHMRDMAKRVAAGGEFHGCTKFDLRGGQ